MDPAETRSSSCEPWDTRTWCGLVLQDLHPHFLLRSPSTAFSTNRGGFLCTHLWVCESSKVGVKVELYADGGAGQGESSDEQHDQHDVGEGRREVDHLRGHMCGRVRVKKKE